MNRRHTFDLWHRWVNSPIRYRLMAAFGLSVILLMAAFAFWQLAEQRDFVNRLTLERAVSISHEVSVSSTTAVLVGDFSGLQEILTGFQYAQDLQRTYFVDLQGRVLASTSRQDVGAMLTDAGSRELLASKPGDQIVLADEANRIVVAHPVMAGNRHIGWVLVEMGRDSANANLTRLTHFWINFTLISFLLVIAISFFLSKRLTRDLSHLTEMAEQVAQGREDVRANIKTADEVGKLSRYLNAMLDKLARQKNEVLAASEALRVSQEGFHRLLDAMAEGVYEVDTAGNCVFVNSAFLRILGYQCADEVVGEHIHELIHHHRSDGSPYPASACRMYQAYQRQEKINVADEVFWRKDGSALPVEYWSHPIIHGGVVIGAIATFIDITERKRAEDALRASEANMREIVQNAPFGAHLYELDEDGRLTFSGANHAAEKILGISHQRFIGKSLEEAFPALIETDIPAAYRRVATGGGNFATEQITYAEGEIHNIFEVHAFQTGKRRMAAFFIDVTERKRHEEQVHNMAFYDALTNLPNRRLLKERLGQAMLANRRNGNHSGLMFLDLDNFKPLNDTYGHAVGDLLLVEVANRIKACVRQMDTVARFGGDEFVVMLDGLSADRGQSNVLACNVAEKIRASLSEPYVLDVNDGGTAPNRVAHRCSASIGVSVFLGSEASQEEILGDADGAMYQAKQNGRNTIYLHDHNQTG